VIIVAAGQGTRLGAGRPKALVLLHGIPIVTHALRGVLRCRDVAQAVVVAPADRMPELTAAVDLAGRDGTPPGVPVRVVAGGPERSHSVALGLAALSADVGIVLVHDAARALTPVEVFDRVIHAVREGHAAVTPALPVADTITRVIPPEAAGGLERVAATVERADLRAVQTPQGFLRETLERAHAHAADIATDDAGLVEQAGGHVHVVLGDPRAMKITTTHDLAVAASWLPESAHRAAPVLLVLGGLPGVGKTSIARQWASRRRAAHVRVDTLEQALLRGGMDRDPGPLGYVAAYELTADQLRLGLDVVADSVNPLAATRDAWREVGTRCGAQVVEVEVVCGDDAEHRRRVEGRTADIDGHRVPDWEAVLAHDYEPWPEVALRVETRDTDGAAAVRAIEEVIG